MLCFPSDILDSLCRRHCSFALYCLPGGSDVYFCMAKDGRTEAGLADGFVISTFEGETCTIPDELDELPQPDLFDELPTEAMPLETTRERYERTFRYFHSLLTSPRSALKKIVLARTHYVASPKLSPAKAFAQALQNTPQAFNVLIHTPQWGTWLFSTPELLLQSSDQGWETMALAGTRPQGTSTPWDKKNVEEQSIVADFIRHTLLQYASHIQEGELSTLCGSSVEHLCTHFRFEMKEENLPMLLAELPPTPAVSGYPVSLARNLLQQHPDIPRQCYAGFLGSYKNNSTHLFVALRGMKIIPGGALLYAGGGIMPDSDVLAEWEETQAKMHAMLRILHQTAAGY